MSRIFFRTLGASLTLLASVSSSFAFSLAGPLTGEAYQVIAIGYVEPGDINTPKNLGEEYRHTTPVIYYYIDSNFRDYFGSIGVGELEKAVAMFNVLSNASTYSSQLSEAPLQTERENYLAEALQLRDVKSIAMNMICEQLGLAEAERWVWTLHDRDGPAAPLQCPAGMTYLVVQRNFDPVASPASQFQGSPYVNGTLYSYSIAEFCSVPGTPPNAIAVPFQVDPLDFGFSSIAGGLFVKSAAVPGLFWTGLTRDDIGGLRYLLRKDNINLESAGTNTLTFVTNAAPTVLYSSNLTLFASAALTNDAATLQGLFPGLVVVASSNYFVNTFITNVTTYFTNFPWDAAGTAAHMVSTTNLVPAVQTRFFHTFGNVFTTVFTSSGWTLVPLLNNPVENGQAFVTLQTQTVGVGGSPWTPAGTTVLTTNTTFSTSQANAVVGDYLILSNGFCSAEIVSSLFTNVTTLTNFIGSVTNNLVVTNAAGGTNSGTVLIMNFSQITYVTNHAFFALSTSCPTNAVSWRGGVEKITFARIPDNGLDELTGLLYLPITNDYSIMAYDPTNNLLYPQRNRRFVAGPDLVFSAQDLVSTPNDTVVVTPLVLRTVPFYNPSTRYGIDYQLLGGPGTIEPGATLVYDKVGPIFLNGSGGSQATQIPIFAWGSFDGTTNLPVVYPNGTSLSTIENMILIQVTPQALPSAYVNVPYNVTFGATGGQPPYFWSLAPTSPGLPPGLTLSTDGTIMGTPTQDGTFDFIIRTRDSAGHVVDHAFALVINP